ncbi:MAG: DUF1592 domain-containing protein [Myxococcales bacterium]|nr:DUF1592 domain-containing protein [Myxococcales bacterium]
MTRSLLPLLVTLSALSLGACSGAIGATTERDMPTTTPLGPTGVSATKFVCDADAAPAARAMFRLSKRQYRNTLHDLLGMYLPAADRDVVMSDLERKIRLIPDDATKAFNTDTPVRGAFFRRMSQDVTAEHNARYFQVAQRAAQDIVSDPGRIAAVFGACADDGDPSNDTDCIERFVRDFGLHALRRPLSESEVSFYVDTVYADSGYDYEANADSLSDVLVVMLMSPRFLYRMEEGDDRVGGTEDVYRLSPYEVAARLSYQFWDSMPDQALFDAAADGSLDTDAGYRAQVDRVFNDPRTAATLDEFYSEWLDLGNVPDPHALARIDDPRFDKFAGDNLPSDGLHDAMIADVLDMTRYYSESDDGTFEDLLLSPYSFARDPELAKIYGVQPWDGNGADLQRFPDADRVGVLGRAALLVAASNATHPIIRGVRVRRNILCDVLNPPPANANRESPEPTSDTQTTRERVEALTSAGSCQNCHAYINGLGFPFEDFDALGRHRDQEPFIEPDGTLQAWLPVDTNAAPRIEQTDSRTKVSGAADLAQQMLDSGKVQACFARHYVRFSMSRNESTTEDGCALESVREEIEAGKPLRDILKSIAFEPHFRERTIPASS